MSKTVYLGMSGGVDSSVSALLLKNAGFHVVGVYMKNWSRDLPGMKCPWAEDLADAKRVATKLDLDFKVFDFEKEYKEKVVDYMLKEFKAGRTPNPDVMCNEEIKFKLFFEKSLASGADFIATGHYAKAENGKLLLAKDENKDQTYFLYRISEEAIAHTLFPVGGMKKPDVKKLAAKKGLDNAYKKESMGVCFVGEVGMEDFLKEYFPEKLGPIIDADTGETVGTHTGAIFYALGQRKGLNLGGGLPYYVVKKDVVKNTIYVSRNLNFKDLWTDELTLEDIVFRDCRNDMCSERAGNPRRAVRVMRAGPPGAELGVGAPSDDSWGSTQQDPNTPATSQLARKIKVRLRHRSELIPAELQGGKLKFEKPVKRPASGQSAVFYRGDTCLGGGIVK